MILNRKVGFVNMWNSTGETAQRANVYVCSQETRFNPWHCMVTGALKGIEQMKILFINNYSQPFKQ